MSHFGEQFDAAADAAIHDVGGHGNDEGVKERDGKRVCSKLGEDLTGIQVLSILECSGDGLVQVADDPTGNHAVPGKRW